MNSAKKTLLLLTLTCSCVSFNAYSSEQEASSEPAQSDETNIDDEVRVEIIDSFAEMHTGPGRGYPIFFTLEQGDTVHLIKRKTHWYYAETSSGDRGWIPATQLARTMKPSGIPVILPTTGHGEYLSSAWRVGFTLGEMEGAENFSVNAGYRALSWLGAELEYGKAYLSSGSLDYYGANVIIEPFSDWGVTPYLSLGLGKMQTSGDLQGSLNAGTDADYTQYGLGLNYYLGFNFLIRTEYRWYSAETEANDNLDINEWKLGFSTFF